MARFLLNMQVVTNVSDLSNSWTLEKLLKEKLTAHEQGHIFSCGATQCFSIHAVGQWDLAQDKLQFLWL